MVERERERIGDYGGEWARCLLQDSVERVLAIYRSVIDTSYLYTRLLAYLLLISLSLSLILVQYISHSLPLFFPSYYHHLSTKLSTILSTILSIYLHHSLCHNSTLAIAISHSLPNNNSQYSLPLILTSLPRPSEIPGLYVI